jgi:hypothetical protein
MAPDSLARVSLIRRRLAAQHLAPARPAAGAREAAAAVCGLQAQDLRGAALQLRSRVPGLRRDQVDDAGLVRVWTWRGTLHLLAPEDRAWMHALCAPRFGARYRAMLEKRGQADVVDAMLDDVLDLIAERPRARSEIVDGLAERGHPALEQESVNVLMPWVALQGHALSGTDGRWRRVDPPEQVDPDEALGTMGRRYLAGYGPATALDLAAWSGQTRTQARRALELAGPLDRDGDLLALEGTLGAAPPDPPECALLGAFDTVLLGWAGRELLVGTNGHHVLPGGGMLRPAVLAGERVVGTWRLRGSGTARRVEVSWFGPQPPADALAAEIADVGRFLGLALEP